VKLFDASDQHPRAGSRTSMMRSSRDKAWLQALFADECYGDFLAFTWNIVSSSAAHLEYAV
jgi:hypothetical protein